MFCPNCGKQIAEGSLFCMSCGTKIEDISSAAGAQNPAPEASAQPVNVAAPAPEANPTPVSQPVYTANPAPQPQIQYQVIQQKPKSHAWIIVLVTVLVLAIAAGVTLLILKPWDSGNDSSYSDEDDDDEDEDDDKDKDKDKDDDKDKDKDKDSDDDKGNDRDDDEKVVTAKPVETKKPVETEAPVTTIPVITDGLTFTVNGKNVPLDLSGYSYIQEGMDGAVVLGLAGCSNNDAYGVAIAINTSRLEENRSYKFEADSNETMIGLTHYNTATGEDFEATSDGVESVSGSFVVTGTDSSDNIAVKIEARLSDDGITYDLKVEGKVAYYSDYNKLSEELDSWLNKIEGSGGGYPQNGGYDDDNDDDDYYGYDDVKCQSCYDTGICGYCYGLGYDFESGDNNSLCKHCNGSGQCRECDAASSSNR